jgi:hypothetical protein
MLGPDSSHRLVEDDAGARAGTDGIDERDQRREGRDDHRDVRDADMEWNDILLRLVLGTLCINVD